MLSQVGWAGLKDKSLVQRERERESNSNSNQVANKRVFKQITIQHAHVFVGVAILLMSKSALIPRRSEVYKSALRFLNLYQDL